MINTGAVIRAIPIETRIVLEKYHESDYPEGTGKIEFLKDYNREMFVIKKELPLGGKFIVVFAESSATLRFTTENVFNSLQEVVCFLKERLKKIT